MDIEANWLEHVLYEIEMYFFTYVFAASGKLERNMAIDCRAIHLRNLACFFYKERHKDNWHVSQFVNDVGGMRLIEDEILFRDLRDYTSRATGHLVKGYRLSHAYKVETMRCYERAFPLLVDASEDFLDAIGDVIKEERRQDWEDERIRKVAAKVRGIIHSAKLRNGGFVTGETGAAS